LPFGDHPMLEVMTDRGGRQFDVEGSETLALAGKLT
jgi:hypothetical protein